MMNVRMVLSVVQTIVQLCLDFILNLIAVMPQLLEMKIFVHLEYLVQKMKEIVTHMMNVRMVLSVVQTIVQIPLDFIMNLIAVITQVLEMNIFVQTIILVLYMKEIVILAVNVKPTLSVTLLIAAQHILDLHLM